MTKLEDVIYNLQLINDVIPDYSEGRNQGLTDKETESLSRAAVSQAINILTEIYENNVIYV